MGRAVLQVPPGFEHPKDADGEYIDGAHWELLEALPDEQLTAWQVYQNTSSGTPVSPVFTDRAALIDWIVAEFRVSRETAEAFVTAGHAPSLLVSGGEVRPGIDCHDPGLQRAGGFVDRFVVAIGFIALIVALAWFVVWVR